MKGDFILGALDQFKGLHMENCDRLMDHEVPWCI